jgi:hypothetical protein
MKLCGQRRGLVTKLHNSSHSPSKRDHPLTATGSFPVGRQGGLPGNEPAFFKLQLMKYCSKN